MYYNESYEYDENDILFVWAQALIREKGAGFLHLAEAAEDEPEEAPSPFVVDTMTLMPKNAWLVLDKDSSPSTLNSNIGTKALVVCDQITTTADGSISSDVYFASIKSALTLINKWNTSHFIETEKAQNVIILVPLHLEHHHAEIDHWNLGIIQATVAPDTNQFTAVSFTLLDPLVEPDLDEHKLIRTQIYRSIKDYISTQVGALNGALGGSAIGCDGDGVTYFAHQTDGISCGVYVTEYGLSILKEVPAADINTTHYLLRTQHATIAGDVIFQDRQKAYAKPAGEGLKIDDFDQLEVAKKTREQARKITSLRKSIEEKNEELRKYKLRLDELKRAPSPKNETKIVKLEKKIASTTTETLALHVELTALLEQRAVAQIMKPKKNKLEKKLYNLLIDLKILGETYAQTKARYIQERTNELHAAEIKTDWASDTEKQNHIRFIREKYSVLIASLDTTYTQSKHDLEKQKADVFYDIAQLSKKGWLSKIRQFFSYDDFVDDAQYYCIKFTLFFRTIVAFCLFVMLDLAVGARMITWGLAADREPVDVWLEGAILTLALVGGNVLALFSNLLSVHSSNVKKRKLKDLEKVGLESYQNRHSNNMFSGGQGGLFGGSGTPTTSLPGGMSIYGSATESTPLIPTSGHGS